MPDYKIKYTKINWIFIYQQYTEKIIINNFLKLTINGSSKKYKASKNKYKSRRAWQARVHRVAKSRTQLKRLSTHACRRAKAFHREKKERKENFLKLY